MSDASASAPFGEESYKLGDFNGLSLKLVKIDREIAPVIARELSRILPWSEIALGEQSLLHHMTNIDPALNRFGVKFGGEIIGAVSVRSPWLKGPYLELLGLLPLVHRRGFGRLIMEWFEREAGDKARNLWLLCSDFNVPAFEFYKALGFIEETRIESLYAEGFTDILLRKRLK